MSRRRKAKTAFLPLSLGNLQRSSTGTLVLLIVLLSSASILFVRFSRHTSKDENTARSPNIEVLFSDAAMAAPVGFQPSIQNHQPAPGPSPKGMVWIPGGEFSMGANEPPDTDDVGMKTTLDFRPIHRVYVDGFYMDQRDVTNAQFAEFVKGTGYVTIAERTPTQEDFPGAPPEKLLPAELFSLHPPRPCLSVFAA